MWDPKAALLVVLIALSVCGAVVVLRDARRKAQLAVGGRRALSDEEFSNQFSSSDQRVIAVEARRLLKAYIPVGHELVQPNDELVRDLQLAAIDGLDANSYIKDLEGAFDVKIEDIDSTQWRTLRDVVVGVHHLQSKSPKQSPPNAV